MNWLLTGGGEEFDLQEVTRWPGFTQFNVMLVPSVNVDRFALVTAVVAEVNRGHL